MTLEWIVATLDDVHAAIASAVYDDTSALQCARLKQAQTLVRSARGLVSRVAVDVDKPPSEGK